MANPIGQNDPSHSSRARRRGVGWTIRISPSGLFLLAAVNLVILGGLAYGISRILTRFIPAGEAMLLTQTSTSPIRSAAVSITPSSTQATQPTASPTALPSATASPEPSSNSPQPSSTVSISQGLIILAMDEGGNEHLFAYQPEQSGTGQAVPLTRLTYGPWDDISPAISPDGQTVAFASNRSGYWDIYLMNLSSGGITRLTDTLAYEAYPSWSPDNQWLVYEAYVADNLEIVIQSAVNPGELIQLTNNPAADFSPAWSPQGRQIAFVSNRSGEDEIWLADLDQGEETRYQNISQDANNKDTHPAWAPDGSALAWVSEQDGMRELCTERTGSSSDTNPVPLSTTRQTLGSGDWPAWSVDGETILTVLQAPNHVYLTAYPVNQPGLTLPAMELPGSVSGLSWANTTLTTAVQTIYQQAAQATSTPLYLPAVGLQPKDNGGRYQLSKLDGIEAPNPYLHDRVDESFLSLRARIASETGWDFLGSLENAFVPLTSPLAPGMGDDWLYTGRAFAIDTLPLSAGWMAVVREDFGANTYWRVYIRALYQDGSAGIPLHDQPWNFVTRYNGDTTIYESGGVPQASIPPGYWIDITERALAYGWERLAALINWRAYYPAARFNEFAAMDGMDWETAMLELYPAEALVTPTVVIPPTRTPTATLRWYVSPTPTNTPTPRPTFTPGVSTPNITPSPNQAPTSPALPGG